MKREVVILNIIGFKIFYLAHILLIYVNYDNLNSPITLLPIGKYFVSTSSVKSPSKRETTGNTYMGWQASLGIPYWWFLEKYTDNVKVIKKIESTGIASKQDKICAVYKNS